MSDYADLVKRLRERYARLSSESNDEARLRRQTERDAAADAIEALMKERDDARAEIFKLLPFAEKEVSKLKAIIEENHP